ncbi:MAG: twin-arginine translocase subunit TatC [Aeromicrobium sp.]|uniref:twin-arginine translocase subunit TatC n=1 Tax=Aeromicrobium sp. TaxID=1871063 RepID=UPI002626943D|nr:twin-arginine translocase subunit TatC [Aeromicrobium sp.]MDF1705111.1 twin-arginine translocase subunit TatC [Aeromicrobium sp.]
MPLLDHLRELRSRLLRGVLAIVAATVLGFVFYEQLLAFLTEPYRGIEPQLADQGIDTNLVITGIGGAFQFQLKIALVAGIVMASPVWIWQLWAFVLPALHRHERRGALLLTGIGVPLFLAGVALAYVILPKAILLLIGFVPDGFESLVSGAEYYDFIIRMMLVFGIAAEIPLAVVLLNRLGVVSGKALVRARPWTVVGIFVFAAVATPSTDPLTMLFLAIPMTILYLVSETIARLTDRRRAAAVPEISDDEASPL